MRYHTFIILKKRKKNSNAACHISKHRMLQSSAIAATLNNWALGELKLETRNACHLAVSKLKPPEWCSLRKLRMWKHRILAPDSWGADQRNDFTEHILGSSQAQRSPKFLSLTYLVFFNYQWIFWQSDYLPFAAKKERKGSRSVVSNSLWPHGLQPTRLLRPWDFPGESTGVGCHFLLQGIFPTQESNPGFLHHRQTLYHLSHQGSLCCKDSYISWLPSSEEFSQSYMICYLPSFKF